MTIIHNTTNIPNQLVAIVYDVISRDLDNTKVKSITLRNKQEGLRRGNWGKYYSVENRITLNVIRGIVFPYQSKSPFLKLNRIYYNRAEWLVAILGHEMRHAWQCQGLEADWLLARRGPKIEYDAEKYEVRALQVWLDYVRKVEVAATKGE